MNYPSGSNLSTLKSSNKSLVLRVLNTQGQASRAELARITGLTKTTIKNIVNEFLKEGVICETGVLDSPSGRKPVLLELSKNSRYSIGVYIARDFIHTSVTNLKGEIIKEIRSFMSLRETVDSFLGIITRDIKTLISSSGIAFDKILGIGVASIGPLDIKKGIILDPPNFRGLKSIQIVSHLTHEFSTSCFLDNDMNASAIAEKLYGKGKDIANFLYVGITNGIGAGFFFNNRLFSGHHGFAGEIGHTTVDVYGKQCPCGNIGCLELYASIPNIVNNVKNSITLGAGTTLKNKDQLTWNDVVVAAKRNDPLCKKAIDNLVYYLSIGLVNVINTYDPEVVFLGHEIALAGGLILKSLNEMVNAHLLFRNNQHVKIEISAFGHNAPCIGAASIVLEKFFTGELMK